MTTFKYTSKPEDRATAEYIIETCAERLERPLDATADLAAASKLDKLISVLEGYVDRAARLTLISALRVRGEIALKLGEFAAARDFLTEARGMADRDSSDTAHKERIAARLADALKALGM